MIKVPRKEYERLKMEAKLANVDSELLIQLIDGFKDIKEGRVRRVK